MAVRRFSPAELSCGLESARELSRPISQLTEVQISLLRLAVLQQCWWEPAAVPGFRHRLAMRLSGLVYR